MKPGPRHASPITAQERALILEQFRDRLIDLHAAAAALRVSRRHFLRLRRRYAEEGMDGLAHRLNGKKSNRALPANMRDHAIHLARTAYRGLAPTQLARILQRKHRTVLNAETLRLWLIEAGLWNPRRRP
jgi:hypothetical protein